jgi:hypothetical protein
LPLQFILYKSLPKFCNFMMLVELVISCAMFLHLCVTTVNEFLAPFVCVCGLHLYSVCISFSSFFLQMAFAFLAALLVPVNFESPYVNNSITCMLFFRHTPIIFLWGCGADPEIIYNLCLVLKSVIKIMS